jgi:hypothetical protein
MNGGIYTEIAKRRAEESNGPKNQGVVPPPVETPALQEAPATPVPKKPRKLTAKETRPLGTVELAATEPQVFDLNIKPDRKGTYLFTDQELYAIDDLKKDLKRRHDLAATQYDIVRSAVYTIVADYRQRGSESIIVQHIKKKKARA